MRKKYSLVAVGVYFKQTYTLSEFVIQLSRAYIVLKELFTQT